MCECGAELRTQGQVLLGHCSGACLREHNRRVLALLVRSSNEREVAA
jgi:hypothetical protein